MLNDTATFDPDDARAWGCAPTPPPLPTVEAAAGRLVAAVRARHAAQVALEAAQAAMDEARAVEVGARAACRVAMAHSARERVEVAGAVVVAVAARTRATGAGELALVAAETVRVLLA